jgi:hypothetical protein
LANTTKHTVSGVAKTSPTGPHSQVQNAAMTSTAISDTPALSPYKRGSKKKLIISSMARKEPTIIRDVIQPGK